MAILEDVDAEGKDDDNEGSSSRQRASSSRASDTDMFLMSSTPQQPVGCDTSVPDAVVISEDDDDDHNKDDYVEDVAEAASASAPANVSSPNYAQFRHVKRRSSVLPPVQKSPFRHDNTRTINGVDDDDEDDGDDGDDDIAAAAAAAAMPDDVQVRMHTHLPDGPGLAFCSL